MRMGGCVCVRVYVCLCVFVFLACLQLFVHMIVFFKRYVCTKPNARLLDACM